MQPIDASTRKMVSRQQLLLYTANLPTSLIGIEACVGSRFLGRALRERGHEVRLILAQFVRPFVKSNKNDYRDAEAIAEAVERENMRFVPIKTEDQLDVQALHRVRERLVSRRTSVINQIRAFLLERGISFAKGPASLLDILVDKKGERTSFPTTYESWTAGVTHRFNSLVSLRPEIRYEYAFSARPYDNFTRRGQLMFAIDTIMRF